MDNQTFILLAARILSGEASEKDTRDLEKLLNGNKIYKEKFDLLKAHWENKRDIPVNVEAALKKIISRIEQDSNKNETATVVISPEKLRRRQFRVLFFRAAAILVAGVSSIYLISRNIKPEVPATAIATPALSNWQVEQTYKGKKSTILLEDGTTVILNADSRLRFPRRFSDSSREVYLTGEAFFDVTHKAGTPFIIHTEKMNIKVLGTEFNVKSYPEDSAYETTLIHGSIEVTLTDRPSDRIILKPKEKLIVSNLSYSKTTTENPSAPPARPQILVSNLHYISKTDSNVVETSWVDNKLVFRDESFENLATDMSRKYGREIRFANEDVKKYRFTGIFKEETIEEVLSALQLTEKFNYRIVDSTIFIF